MTKNDLPKSSQELITRFCPIASKGRRHTSGREAISRGFNESPSCNDGENGKTSLYSRFSFCSGTLNSELPMICIPSNKYKEVQICLKDGWSYPIATIKLSNTNRLIDAEKRMKTQRNWATR